MSEFDLLGLAGVIVLGLGGQWLAWRLRLPAILVLLALGGLAGPGLEFATAPPTATQRLGALDPDDLLGPLLPPIVSFAVAVLLFESGLALRFADLARPNRAALRLGTVGALLTGLVSSAAAHFILELDPSSSVLLGAVLMVAGPCEIAPRSRHVRAVRPIGAVLESESTVLGALGPLVAVAVFTCVTVEDTAPGLTAMISALATTVLVGGGLGLSCAWLIAVFLRLRQIPDYLLRPVALMFVVFMIAWAGLIQQEAGLFAATVMGIVLANQRFADVKRLADSGGTVRVLLVGGLFIVLGARLRLESFGQLGWDSLAFVAVLMLVARPLSVLIAAIGAGLKARERLLLSASAPRGVLAAGLASAFALRLEEKMLFDQADALVLTTFAVVIVTCVFYVPTASPLMRWAAAAEAEPAPPATEDP